MRTKVVGFVNRSTTGRALILTLKIDRIESVPQFEDSHGDRAVQVLVNREALEELLAEKDSYATIVRLMGDDEE